MRFCCSVRLTAAIWTMLICVSAGAAPSCGPPDLPCRLDQGAYHIALPAAVTGAPAVLWLHGFGRSGKQVLANAQVAGPIIARGYALIAPDGQPFTGDTGNFDWGVNDGHRWARDDIAFMKAVLTDAMERFGLDRSRVLVAGFSRGGSMVWDLACRAPRIAAGFAAVSGAFWEPMFETCAGPVHLLHTHGFSDRLVPLEGRQVTFHGIHFTQGNVYKGLEIWRRIDGCRGGASRIETTVSLWRKTWDRCDHGSLTLQLTPGGHAIPAGSVDGALDWFEALTTAGP